jgi:hypothetical protein
VLFPSFARNQTPISIGSAHFGKTCDYRLKRMPAKLDVSLRHRQPPIWPRRHPKNISQTIAYQRRAWIKQDGSSPGEKAKSIPPVRPGRRQAIAGGLPEDEALNICLAGVNSTKTGRLPGQESCPFGELLGQ